MALCAVPLGVLKSGSIKFIPELTQRKLEGIKRLGFGLLNEVAMLFPYVFWGTDLNTFGHLSDDQSSPEEFFLFYNYATVAGGPLLIALVAGEAAHKFESMPPTDAVTQVLQILKVSTLLIKLNKVLSPVAKREVKDIIIQNMHRMCMNKFLVYIYQHPKAIMLLIEDSRFEGVHIRVT